MQQRNDSPTCLTGNIVNPANEGSMLLKPVKRLVKSGINLVRPDSVLRRLRLGGKPFSIISDDCWGGSLYKEFIRPYNTPFIDLLIPPPDFIHLINNFDRIVNSPLRFVDRSRWYDQWPDSRNCPVALLDDDVEIQFRHYQNEDEARTKWTRRLARLDYDNLFFKMTGDNNAFIKPEYEAFEKLETSRKIAFSRTKQPYSSVVTIPPNVFNIDAKRLYGISTNYFNIVDWLQR